MPTIATAFKGGGSEVTRITSTASIGQVEVARVDQVFCRIGIALCKALTCTYFHSPF